MSATLASVGALTLDWVQTPSGRIGPFPAGNALYAAVGGWLALGIPLIVARIGADYPADRIAATGLSTAHVHMVPGNSFRVRIDERPEGRELRYLDGSGDHIALDASPAELPPYGTDGVHVGPARASAQLALLEAARKRGAFTTLDLLFVAGRMEPNKDEVLELMPFADAFLPSLADMQRLWPDASPNAMLRRLLDAGCSTVVLKMGAWGSIGSDGRRVVHVPALPAALVDATGAGDAFCGAFHMRCLEYDDLPDAMAWATAAASVVIEGYGALHGVNNDARIRCATRQAEAASTVVQTAF